MADIVSHRTRRNSRCPTDAPSNPKPNHQHYAANASASRRFHLPRSIFRTPEFSNIEIARRPAPSNDVNQVHVDDTRAFACATRKGGPPCGACVRARNAGKTSAIRRWRRDPPACSARATGSVNRSRVPLGILSPNACKLGHRRAAPQVASQCEADPKPKTVRDAHSRARRTARSRTAETKHATLGPNSDPEPALKTAARRRRGQRANSPNRG